MPARKPNRTRRRRIAPANRPAGVSAPNEKRRLFLHRSVAVITRSRVEIRPALGAALAPLVAFVVGGGAFAIVLAGALGGGMPVPLMLLALLVAVVLIPLAGMGFVYSIVGAAVVIDAGKRSATWQQGMLGLGVGTREMVPFEKIAAIVISEVSRSDADAEERRVEPVVQWDLVLEKTSGRELTIGTVSVLLPNRWDAYDRLAEVAAAICGLTGAPFRGAE